MRRFLTVGLLMLAISPALAQSAAGPPSVSTYCQNSGGTAWIPCVPGSGGGGGSGSVGTPGTAGTSAQSVTTTNAGANGTDSSNAMPAPLTVLATFTVTQPGSYYVQDQSAGTLQVIFDNGAGGAISTELLGPGAGAGQQGGDTSPPMPWFTGRIQVAGATGAQFMARHN